MPLEAMTRPTSHRPDGISSRSSELLPTSPPTPLVSLGDQFHSILQAARTGAEWAWVALYREVAPVVVRYLRARGASEPDDVLGEVMVRVVLKLAQFQGGASEFRAWVLAIARNRLFDEFRRRSRRPVDPAPDERVVASGPIGDAEDDALRRLEAQRVRSILGRLSPDQRDVLLLRILGRLTIEEVARVVGKRPGAVKALQARGLAAIRRAISAEAVSL